MDKLNNSIEEIVKQTQDEADEYYKNGEKYMIEGEVKPFICTRWQENGDNHIRFDACYETKTGTNHLYCAPEKMGTFLPDVATNNSAIIKLDSLQELNSAKNNSIQNYCNKVADKSSLRVSADLTL